MQKPLLGIAVSLAFGCTAAAESALVDLSQPVTGKIRSLIHADGRPVEFGAPLRDKAASSGGAAPRFSGGGGNASAPSCGESYYYGALNCETANGSLKRVGIRTSI